MSDTEVIHVIHSKEEFLLELHSGSDFWYMSSRNFRPYTIEGPFRILDFAERGKESFLNVRCHITRGHVRSIEYHSINDLTNEHHGVFTDKEEAWVYFKEKRRDFDAQGRGKR